MRKSTEKRLLPKIEVTGFCWLWKGPLNDRGYGEFRVAHKMLRAHRAVYWFLVEEPPEGLVANHLCYVRHCVNPDHLEFVTQRENVMYSFSPASENARKTHCKRGHELLGSNLYVKPSGQRICRTCKNNEQNSARREGRRAWK